MHPSRKQTLSITEKTGACFGLAVIVQVYWLKWVQCCACHFDLKMETQT